MTGRVRAGVLRLVLLVRLVLPVLLVLLALLVLLVLLKLGPPPVAVLAVVLSHHFYNKVLLRTEHPRAAGPKSEIQPPADPAG